MEEEEKQVFTRVWAPTLVSFTNWVLKALHNKGISKVFFLARDAYMSYLIAQKIVNYQHLSIECKYLEGSRYAWRMAEFSLPDVDPLEKICIGGLHVTLQTILRRGGLTEEEQSEVMKQLKSQGIGTDGADTLLTYSEVIELKEKLKSCEKLMYYIHNHAKQAYGNVIGYFQQEGLITDAPIAIVDSGWVGSLQQTLTRLLVSTGHILMNPIQGYYFGLYELPSGVDSCNYHTFYFRPYRDIERKVRFSNCLFEAVCGAPEGMTVGYCCTQSDSNTNDKIYIPIRECPKNFNYGRSIENIAIIKSLISDEDTLIQNILPRAEIAKRLTKLMSHPTKEQAEQFGSYQFSDDVFSDMTEKVAIDLDNREIRNLHAFRRMLIMTKLKEGQLKDTPWPEGSVINNGNKVVWHLKNIQMYKRLVYIKKMINKMKE